MCAPMMEPTPKGPFVLVTVNTAPQRAKILIGRMIKELEEGYQVIHVDNCSTLEEVAPKVRQHQPHILFSASMWTPSEALKIRAIAERERPGIVTHAIPQGLQVQKGPDAVVDYLLENVPPLLNTLKL